MSTHKSTPDKLVYMANQIATFFRSQDAEGAAKSTAEHIKKFWDPRMRKSIFQLLGSSGIGLDPTAHEAVSRLKEAETNRAESDTTPITRPENGELSDTEIALLCDIGAFSPNATNVDQTRRVGHLLVEGLIEPANQENVSLGARYQLTAKAQELLVARGVGLNES